LTGEGIRIGYLPADERFPHFAVGAADQRVLSVLSTPAIDRGSVVGSLNIYSRVRDAFDERDRDAATIIAAEIANALRKSTVLSAAMNIRDRLQEEHDEVVLVARAQGVLMSIHECSSAQARDLIRHAAEGNNESLIVVAERILASMSPDLEEVGERSPERGDAH
jgi:GAF domain-containing protein